MPDAFSRIVRAAKTVENARRCLKTLPEHEATEAIDELARRLGYKVLAILFPEGRETEWSFAEAPTDIDPPSTNKRTPRK